MVNRNGPLIAGDIRRNIIPATDLDLQGDTGQPLQLLSDVEVEIALLSILGPDRPRIAQAGLSGGLLITPIADPAQVLGTTGNLWNNASPAAGARSAIFDAQNFPNLTVMIATLAGNTFTQQYSADGVNWFGSGTIIPGLGATVVVSQTIGARFYSLLVANAGDTITATVQAKP